MTARQVFEGMLTELSKVNAPSLLLEDFNYFFNKAIYQYINKRYNIYDINQQTTDDIRVLKSTAVLTPKLATFGDITIKGSNEPIESLQNLISPISTLYGATYEVDLPKDYLHILNCICVYHINKQIKCYNKGSYWQRAAKRLTADAWSTIVDDYYNRPLPTRPYYYIHNVSTNNDNLSPVDMINEYSVVPTDTTDYKSAVLNALITGKTVTVTTLSGKTWGEPEEGEESEEGVEYTQDINDIDYVKTFKNNESVFGEIKEQKNVSNFDRIITIGGKDLDVVEKDIATRIGNSSNVRMEIRYGRDNSVFELVQVFIDYIKVPQYIRLTQEQLDLTEDTSQIMEFPDYVCQEIINELVHIVMENTADPRLQSHIPVSQSVANPAQAQTQQQAQQA